MRSGRFFLVVAATVIAFFVVPTVVAANSTPTVAHLVKDCGSFNGAPSSFCTITVSDLEALPPGSRIVYLGPVLDNAYFLSSNVIADAGSNGTATGYCVFNGKTSSGLCSFWMGTGALAGFTAIFDVTVDSSGLFHLDGTYYFADVAKTPDTSTEDVTLVPSARITQRPF